MPNEIRAFLERQNVIVDVEARCKREALSRLAAHASKQLELNETKLLDALIDREQLGTTAIGHGIALPHAKVEIGRLWGMLARLSRPVDFDALDDKPVDLLFLLLAPADATAEHLKALSRIARFVRSPVAQSALRGANDANALYGLAIGEIDARAA